ncbi:MAG: LamG-like jellyroll fold domain-containing protein, partial [Candidatus Thorarchaeota archaeon]
MIVHQMKTMRLVYQLAPNPHFKSEFYGEATNDRIEAPHSSSLVLQTNMLVEAWIRTSNTDPTSDVIVAKWGDVGHRNYWLGKFDGSTLAFFVDNTQNVTASLSFVNDGDWHHVVGVANT